MCTWILIKVKLSSVRRRRNIWETAADRRVAPVPWMINPPVRNANPENHETQRGWSSFAVWLRDPPAFLCRMTSSPLGILHRIPREQTSVQILCQVLPWCGKHVCRAWSFWKGNQTSVDRLTGRFGRPYWHCTHARDGKIKPNRISLIIQLCAYMLMLGNNV